MSSDALRAMSERPAYADFEPGADSPLFDIHSPAGIRDFLFEPDGRVQHVVERHLYGKMLVDIVCSHEVESTQRHLLHIAQSHDTYSMDSRSLKVVKEGQTEARTVPELRRIADIGIRKVR